MTFNPDTVSFSPRNTKIKRIIAVCNVDAFNVLALALAGTSIISVSMVRAVYETDNCVGP